MYSPVLKKHYKGSLPVIEMTQGFWQNQLATGGARRHE